MTLQRIKWLIICVVDPFVQIALVSHLVCTRVRLWWGIMSHGWDVILAQLRHIQNFFRLFHGECSWHMLQLLCCLKWNYIHIILRNLQVHAHNIIDWEIQAEIYIFFYDCSVHFLMKRFYHKRCMELKCWSCDLLQCDAWCWPSVLPFHTHCIFLLLISCLCRWDFRCNSSRISPFRPVLQCQY